MTRQQVDRQSPQGNYINQDYSRSIAACLVISFREERRPRRSKTK